MLDPAELQLQMREIALRLCSPEVVAEVRTKDKVTAARAWLAQREAERGPHRYSSVPTVLLPVAQRRVQREQERRHG